MVGGGRYLDSEDTGSLLGEQETAERSAYVAAFDFWAQQAADFHLLVLVEGVDQLFPRSYLLSDRLSD